VRHCPFSNGSAIPFIFLVVIFLLAGMIFLVSVKGIAGLKDRFSKTDSEDAFTVNGKQHC